MKKREQQFTTIFQKWLKYNWHEKNSYFEIKVSRTNSLPFSDVKEHQKDALKVKKFIYKFSDAIGWGTPFDVIFCEGKGYVVISFYKPRNKIFYIIDVDTWIEEEKTSKRKSLTEERARVIGRACSF